MKRKGRVVSSILCAGTTFMLMCTTVAAGDPWGHRGPSIHPYGGVEAEANFGSSVCESTEADGRKVMSLEEGDYFRIIDVDFDKGLSGIDINYKADEPSIVEVRSGKIDGRLIAKLRVDATHGEYKLCSAPTNGLSGINELYFVCTHGACSIDNWTAFGKGPDDASTVDPYNYVEAENGTGFEESAISEDAGRKVVSFSKEGDYFKSENVDLKFGANSFMVLAKSNSPAVIEIRDGGIDGKCLDEIMVSGTNNEYKCYIADEIPSLSGVHDLYFVNVMGQASVDKWCVSSMVINASGDGE